MTGAQSIRQPLSPDSADNAQVVLRIPRGCTFSYGEAPLFGIPPAGDAIELRKGRVYGVFGPNGCGKTTLLNVLSGLTPLSSGAVEYYDDSGRVAVTHGKHGFHYYRTPVRLARLSQGQRRTFQVPRVPLDLCVSSFVDAGRRKPKGEHPLAWLNPAWLARCLVGRMPVHADVDASLAEFGIVDPAQPAAELSYGQQRLAAVLQVLNARPRLIMFDEPFANLHPTIIIGLKVRLRQLIAGACDGTPRMAVIVEHTPEHLIDLADCVLVFKAGVLTAVPLEQNESMRIKQVQALWVSSVTT